METHVVIMAGGIGSRFWPMSTPQTPKQFVDVLGCGRTMIQMTVDRLLPLCPVTNIWVVTSAAYVPQVRLQVPDIPADNILAEPAARNTAPCIAYASWKISQRHPDANILVCPSDALVLDAQTYRAVLSKALEFTASREAIVTVGIKPTRPETGYGYIFADPSRSVGDVLKVSSFKEKPDLATAREYVADTRYLWNAGIFVWKVSTIIAALRRFAPQIAAVMDRIAPDLYTDREQQTVDALFPTCDKISIDYAVMEHSQDIFTIPGDFGWSDLGTWGSLREVSARDDRGNAVITDGAQVSTYACDGCVMHISDMQTVVVEGLKDCIVACKDGRLLICRLSEEQRIRDFVK